LRAGSSARTVASSLGVKTSTAGGRGVAVGVEVAAGVSVGDALGMGVAVAAGVGLGALLSTIANTSENSVSGLVDATCSATIWPGLTLNFTKPRLAPEWATSLWSKSNQPFPPMALAK